MRAAARDLQRIAWENPLGRARSGPHDPKFFVQIDREIRWGLTLNR